jgi:hypothetical protein
MEIFAICTGSLLVLFVDVIFTTDPSSTELNSLYFYSIGMFFNTCDLLNNLHVQNGNSLEGAVSHYISVCFVRIFSGCFSPAICQKKHEKKKPQQ